LNLTPSLLEVRRNQYILYRKWKCPKNGCDICKRCPKWISIREMLLLFWWYKCRVLSDDLGDIDHFFPHTLQGKVKINLNGVWNLVLACKSCNRGTNGKFARVPTIKLLERLHKRNSFFIDSHHPLRETLIIQTGKKELDRVSFLKIMDSIAINHLIHRWQPFYEHSPVF
jgi:hypothetical protein